MVANGLGVTLLPEIAVKANILGSARLKVKKFKGDSVARKIGLAWRKTDPRHEDYRLLGEFIRDWSARRLKVPIID